MKLLLALAAVATGCTTMATVVEVDQKRIPTGTGVAYGRLGFVARKKITLRSFQMAAVQVPDGEKFWIKSVPLEDVEDGDDPGSFFVSLPTGHYRLTQWQAIGAEGSWAGEDAGLSIEVVPDQAVCVGALYLHPREKQWQLDAVEEPPTMVRDECAHLGNVFRERSPLLAPKTLVRIAQPVSRRKS